MKKIFKIMGFSLLFGTLVWVTMQVFMDSENYAKYDEFYEEKEDFDVLFFGSSRMLVSVNPLQLYEEQGITSYNMAQHAEGLKITYWQVENAIKYTKPKVIVLDTSLFWIGRYTEENLTGLSYLHKSLDHMNLSLTKYNALKDNVSDEIDISEYMLPFLLYHSRYDQLSEEDIIEGGFYYQGAELKYGTQIYEEPIWNDEIINEEFSVEGINLQKIYDLCQEKNIQMVFTYMPIEQESLSESVCADVNYIENWGKEREIPFLNIATEDFLVNYQTDLYDAVHVNVLGMKKITSYIGDFLADNYSFSTKMDKTIQSWNTKILEYSEVEKNKIVNETVSFNTFIQLISQRNYTYVISVNQEKEFFNHPDEVNSLVELGAQTNFTGYGETKPSYTMIYDAKENKRYEFINESSILIDTSIGKVEINYNEERKKKSDVGGYVYHETVDDARLDIMIFDSETGELITRRYF